MKTLHAVILALILLTIAASCSRRHRTMHRELDRISAVADTAPYLALHLLDSIAPTIGTSDRNLLMHHNLVLVKARDKADMPFTSDSLIRPVVDYYRDRGPSDTLLPLALYYGGRAYSELGDAPRALDYFRQALAALPDSANSRLRGYIHAQSAGLFVNQSLHQLALKEMKSAYRYSEITHDTIALINDLINIAAQYKHISKDDSALIFYNRAYEIAQLWTTDEWTGIILGQMANSFIISGDITRADSLMSKAMEHNIPNWARSSFYSILCDLYIAKGDTVNPLPYFKWLNDSGSIYAKVESSRHLLLKNIKEENYPNANYFLNRMCVLIDSINSMEATEAIARMNATYNYSMRERENERLLRDKLRLQRNITVIITLSLIIILTAAAVLRKMYIRRRELMQLRQVIADIESRNDRTHLRHDDISLSQIPDIVTILDKAHDINPHFSSSDWAVIENAIKQCHPDLYTTLRTGNILTDTEWHVVMLIKLGLTTKKISEILHLSPNSISTVKARLSKKLQGPDKASARDLNGLIYSL